MYDHTKDQFASIKITTTMKFLVLKPSLSCSLCENDHCDIIIHSSDPNFECKFTEKKHDSNEPIYIENSTVFMEYNLVPYIFAQNPDSSKVNLTFSDDAESDNPPTIFLTLLTFIFISFMFLSQSHKKQKLKRWFFSTKKKKVRQSAVMNQDTKQKTRAVALVTSHKNADTFLPRKGEQQSFVTDESQWTYVTTRRWYSDC